MMRDDSAERARQEQQRMQAAVDQVVEKVLGPPAQTAVSTTKPLAWWQQLLVGMGRPELVGQVRHFAAQAKARWRAWRARDLVQIARVEFLVTRPRVNLSRTGATELKEITREITAGFHSALISLGLNATVQLDTWPSLPVQGGTVLIGKVTVTAFLSPRSKAGLARDLKRIMGVKPKISRGGAKADESGGSGPAAPGVGASGKNGVHT